MLEQDYKYMAMALEQAKIAYALEETPIGCVIVYQDRVIGRGYNRRASDHSVLAHAEMMAIAEAEQFLNDWRLEDCTIYVTLEPCPMCAGAIVQSRIKRLVYASPNFKAGCAGTILNLMQVEGFNHQVLTDSGVMESECTNLLKDFFKNLRLAKKEKL